MSGATRLHGRGAPGGGKIGTALPAPPPTAAGALPSNDAPCLQRSPRPSAARRRSRRAAPADRRRLRRPGARHACDRDALRGSLYPEYRALTGAALEGLWENVRYLVAGFYQFNLIQGRSPTMKELDQTIANAEARVTQGVSLGAMIGTYQLALPILWEHLIETVGPHPEFRMELA